MTAVMKLKEVPTPTGWRVLIKIQDIPETTEHGIIIPDQYRDTVGQAAQVAEVISLGEEAYTGGKMKGVWCKPGDWVLISKYAGVRIDVKGEEYRLLNDDELLAITVNPSN